VKEGEGDDRPRKRRYGGWPVGYSGRIDLKRVQCSILTHCQAMTAK
jgi:hypothetical protein